MKNNRKPDNRIWTYVLENDALFRESLCASLSAEPALYCAGRYASHEEALQQISCHSPAILIMDVHSSSGSEDVNVLRARYPALRILILTWSEDDRTIVKSFRAGAAGYLLKSSTRLEIFSAIRELYRGGTPLSDLIAGKNRLEK